MKKYICYIPKFQVEVKAKDSKDAYNKAGEIYDDYKLQDDDFGDLIVELKEDDTMLTVGEQTQFIALLEKFIDDCGLDRIEACKKAQELLDIINE